MPWEPGEPPSSAIPSRRRVAAVMALCAAAYLYVFPYFPTINNPNEHVRLYMTAALVEQGTYRIDSIRDRWGWTNDAAVRDGHYYSVKAPGTSFLGIPGYALYYHGAKWLGYPIDLTKAMWFCRVAGSIVPTLLFLYLFYPWLGRFTSDPILRDCVFVSVGFGSLLYGYGMMFVSHTISAIAAFGCFMLLEQADRDRSAPCPRTITPARALGAGFLAAAVTLFEYPGLVVSVILAAWALWVLRSPRPIIWFALGGLVPTLAMMHFQWKAFGNPLSPGHRFLETPDFQALAHKGFFGAVAFQPNAALRLLFDPEMGLFPYTPVLLLAPAGFLLAKRPAGRVQALVAALCFIAPWLVISLMVNWRGGWTIGPRYLALVVPFAAWAALYALDTLGHRARDAARVVALGAAGAGLLLSGVTSAWYPHIPPSIDRPLVQFILPLARYDFAPPNAAHVIHWNGTASMLPWAAALMALWIACLVQAKPKVAAVSLLVCGLLVVPSALPWKPDAAQRELAFVSTRWVPRGHDAPSRLEAELRASPTAEGYERLARMYLALGRGDDAARARDIGVRRLLHQ